MKSKLLFAPFPALVGSVFLMLHANASSMIWIQQLVFALTALLLCGVAIRKSYSPIPKDIHVWIVLVSFTFLLLPFFSSASEGPQRWLNLGGFQLYVSALVLPSLIVLLVSAERMLASSKIWIYFAYVGVTLSLAIQPDAPQATSFSIAVGLSLLTSKSSIMVRTTTFVGLLVCTLWAWSQPDPLKPVPYVEGVIELALHINYLALAAAIVVLAIPVISLVHYAKSANQTALFFVAVYYISIYFLAGLTQLTPMPLLGFGAAPVLGYFTLIYVIVRLKGKTKADSHF